MTPTTQPSTVPRTRFPWLVGGAFFAMFLAGLPGVYDRLVHDHVHTAGLWVVGFVFFSGIAAGAFPVAALPHVFGYRRFRPLVGAALLVAFSSLVAAMFYALVDLGRPDRALAQVLLRPDTSSVMFWVVASYGVYSALLTTMAYFAFRPHWGESAAATGRLAPRLLALGYRGTPKQVARNDAALRVVGSAGLLVALTLGVGVGMLFAGIGNRAFSNSALFPTTFIVSALLSGAALVLAASTLVARGGHAFKTTLLLLARFTGLLLVAELVIIVLEAVLTLNGGIPSHVAVLRAIGIGPHAWVFWVMQVGFGTLVALWLLVGTKRPSLAVASVAALYILVGVLAFRLNVVMPQLVGTSTAYVPSLVEWNVMVCGVGIAGLVFLTSARLLPAFPASAPMEFELAAHATEAVPLSAGVSDTAERTEVTHV